MKQSMYLPVYFNDRQDPTNFGIVSDTAFLTFEEAKEEVIKQLSAELQSYFGLGRRLTADEINSRLDEAREAIESPGDDYVSDYACCIFGVCKVHAYSFKIKKKAMPMLFPER